MVVPKQELGNQDSASHEIVIIYLWITLSIIFGRAAVPGRPRVVIATRYLHIRRRISYFQPVEILTSFRMTEK